MSNNTGLQVFSKIFISPAKDTAQIIQERVLNGEADVAQVAIALKKLAKVAEEVTKGNTGKEVKELLEQEILKYKEGTKKTFDVLGSKVQEANKTFWDFSSTEDPYLERLQEIKNQADELIKLRETELKNKAESWNSTNKVSNIAEFGIQPFNVVVEKMPKLIFEEAYAEIPTNPPAKIVGTQLKFFV